MGMENIIPMQILKGVCVSMNKELYFIILQHMTLVLNYLQSNLYIKSVTDWQHLRVKNYKGIRLIEGREIPVIAIRMLKASPSSLSYAQIMSSWKLLDEELYNRDFPMYCVGYYADVSHIRAHLVYSNDINVQFIAQRYLQKHLYDVVENMPIGLLGG